MENQVTNNNDEIEIDLGEIFHLILSRLGVITNNFDNFNFVYKRGRGTAGNENR